MILSDGTIRQLLDDKTLVIEPLVAQSIQPASVDCRIGNHFLVVESTQEGIIKMNSEIKYREVISESMLIPPHSFLLAMTQEYIELPHNLTAFVEGRSSIGRMGLFIQNAGWVDPGFKGNITLQLYNANSLPIEVQAGRRVCQLVLCKMDQAALKPYAGKYQGQRVSTGSRVFKDKEIQ
jgi:dCTP deaminase